MAFISSAFNSKSKIARFSASRSGRDVFGTIEVPRCTAQRSTIWPGDFPSRFAAAFTTGVSSTESAAVATPTALPPGDALLQRLDERLHFSGEQKEKLRPLCDELGKEMEAAGNRMDWRREIFNTYAPRIREQLTTNQLAAYDQMVADAPEALPIS